jgi:enoyl-CoA hydratase/carnithine racemase
MASSRSFPESYNTFTLPELRFSHHPPTSPTVTPVVLVILNRPEARNAFTDTMTVSLVEAFNLLSADTRVKCIVLTGSDRQNKTFCAGMDLVMKPKETPSTRDTHRDGGGLVTLAMYNCNKPIVAAINGSAVGVGITMTLPCNIRVVSNKAKVGFVFGRRGFNMEACSSFFLPRLIGTSKAMHLVTTGAVYPSTHHLFRDLFSEIVDPDQVLPRALAIADEIAGNVSNVAVRIMKDMIYRGPDSPEGAHLLESRLFWDLFRGKDTKEGIESFLQKRPAKFEATMENDAPVAYPWWKDDLLGEKSKL